MHNLGGTKTIHFVEVQTCQMTNGYIVVQPKRVATRLGRLSDYSEQKVLETDSLYFYSRSLNLIKRFPLLE